MANSCPAMLRPQLARSFHTLIERQGGVLAWLDFGSRPMEPFAGYSMDWQTRCVAKGDV